MSTTAVTTAAPELLAPAGDWDSLRAAVGGGADAVYFGLSNFNARHRATNFTLEELPEVIAYLHERNVRGYVTCNTLVFSDELSEIARFISAISAAGADAVIVQDLGLVRLIRQLAPDLPIHGSTQMTLTEPRGIEFVRELGAERVIVARELSIDEIRAIRAETSLPLEVFVHGALCVAYSGQCLTSEALGGRSANRGQCAQACRLPYELIVDGQRRDLGDVAYLLSPQDLASHDLISSLIDAGACSLKIEGRLKSAEYVAITTSTYRAALDAALAKQPFQLSQQEELDLSQSFSRGFTPGFLAGADHQRLVQGRFPKSRGVRAGRFVGLTPRGAIVELGPEHSADLLKAGDGVVFDEGHPDQDEQGGRLYFVNPLKLPHDASADAGTRVELVFGPGAVNFAALSPGAIVWKTNDPTLRKRMERTYSSDQASHRVPLTFTLAGRPGEPLSVTARDDSGHVATTAWPGPLQEARKHPLTAESAREQLDRLKETPFEFAEVELDLPAPVMVPKSVLNDLRRQVVAELMTRRETGERERRIAPQALETLRAAVRAGTSNPGKAGGGPASMVDVPPAFPGLSAVPRLYVLARTMPQLEAVVAWSRSAPSLAPAMVYCDFEDVRRYRDAVAVAREGGLPVGLATLRVIKPGEEGLLRQIAKARADAILVRNLASIAFCREHAADTPLVGDYSLNASNELTADLYRSQGLTRLVPSYDLNWEQMTAMLGRIDPGLFEIVIHQHMPMFHMEHCVFAHTLSDGKDWRDCGRPCDRHRVELHDRAGATFPLVADTGCRNTVYNSVAQSGAEYVPRMLAAGLRHFRVELLRETPEEIGPLLDRYGRVLSGLDDGRSAWRGLQVLNQLGVTRGTFQLS